MTVSRVGEHASFTILAKDKYLNEPADGMGLDLPLLPDHPLDSLHALLPSALISHSRLSLVL